MMPEAMPSSRDILMRVQSLSTIEALDPALHADQLAAELAPATTIAELETRDAQLVAALGDIDELTTRVMRIRLEHALASDSSIAAPTRKVFASTVVSYASDLGLLAGRVRDVAARGGARDPDEIAALVVEAARATLALRDAVRAGVLALVQRLATAAIPEADRQARDPDLADAVRKRWSAVRRDLEVLAAEPAQIVAAPMAKRLAAWPEQLDEPAPKPEPTLAELIELD